MTRLAFGEWLPDLPEHENPGALVAKNCIPELLSYRSLRGTSPFSDSVGANVLGSSWARANDRSVFNFAGTSSALFSLTNTSWNDVSRTVGGAYSAANWEFVQFGDRVIAANIANELQQYDLNVDTNFSDVTDAPRAARIAVVRDFVVCGDVEDNGVRDIEQVRWSAFNNPDLWEPSPTTQADFQRLQGGGEVRKIVGGEVGVIFQERAITRMTYKGPPEIFRFDQIERERGTTSPNSVVSTGTKAFFYTQEGFFSLDLLGGTEAVPIGANRVDSWFARDIAQSEIPNIQGSVDQVNNLVIWAYKTDSSEPANNRVIIYNYQADKWSYAEIALQNISQFITSSFTLDQLDSVLPQGIDIDSIPVDSPAFSGNFVNLILFDSENRSATLNGDPLMMCVDTKEFSQDGGVTFVNAVRPLAEADGPMSITSLTRNRLFDTPTVSLPVAVDDTGKANIRASGRYHRYRLTGAPDFAHVSGVEFNASRRGRV